MESLRLMRVAWMERAFAGLNWIARKRGRDSGPAHLTVGIDGEAGGELERSAADRDIGRQAARHRAEVGVGADAERTRRDGRPARVGIRAAEDECPAAGFSDPERAGDRRVDRRGDARIRDDRLAGHRQRRAGQDVAVGFESETGGGLRGGEGDRPTGGSVEDGEAAITQLSSALEQGQPYGLILTDMHMPNMDGLAAARAIRRENPSAHIVMISLQEPSVLKEITSRHGLAFVDKANLAGDLIPTLRHLTA